MDDIKKGVKEEVKKRDKSEKQRIAENKKKVLATMEDTVKIRFQNIESPGFNVEFTYNGVKGYNLLDGYEYEIPKVVATHLNNLTKPKYKWSTDPVTKLPKCIAVGKDNRFSCIPVSF